MTYINKIYKCDNSKTKRHDTKKTINKLRSKIKIKHWIIRAVEAIYSIRQCRLSNRRGNKTEGLGFARPLWDGSIPKGG